MPRNGEILDFSIDKTTECIYTHCASLDGEPFATIRR